MTRASRRPALFVAILLALAFVSSMGVTRIAGGSGAPAPRSAAAFDPHKEAVFEGRGSLGGEAERRSDDSPAAEQVANRAYPRTYVDDRLASKARKAFDAKPHQAAQGTSGSDQAVQAAAA